MLLSQNNAPKATYRSAPAIAQSCVRQEPLWMPGRAVPGLRAGAVRVQPAPKSESKVGRWESPHDLAHDDDDVLAPRRHADEHTAVYGAALRQAER